MGNAASAEADAGSGVSKGGSSTWLERVREKIAGSEPEPEWDTRERERVIEELCETELTYVKALRQIVEHIIAPLRKRTHFESPTASGDGKKERSSRLSVAFGKKKPSAPSVILSGKNISLIFSNLEELLKVHELLCERLLLLRVSNDGSKSRAPIGELFVEFAPALLTYTHYVNNYEVSMATLGEQRQRNKEFDSFLTEAKASCDGHDLPSLMIMPVQRLPRYVLLLQEVLKLTPDFVKDRTQLSHSLLAIQEVTHGINDSKRHAEHAALVAALSERVIGVYGAAKKTREFRNLALPHRRFLAQGSCYFIKNGASLAAGFGPQSKLAKSELEDNLLTLKRKDAKWFLFSDSVMILVPVKKLKLGFSRREELRILTLAPLSELRIAVFGEVAKKKAGKSLFGRLTAWGSAKATSEGDLPVGDLPEVSRPDQLSAVDECLCFSSESLILGFATGRNAEVDAETQFLEHADEFQSSVWGAGGYEERDAFAQLIRSIAARMKTVNEEPMVRAQILQEQTWLSSQRG